MSERSRGPVLGSEGRKVGDVSTILINKVSKTGDDLKSIAEWTPPASDAIATGSTSPMQKSTAPTRSGE
jgi:hypothetical protein